MRIFAVAPLWRDRLCVEDWNSPEYSVRGQWLSAEEVAIYSDGVFDYVSGLPTDGRLQRWDIQSLTFLNYHY
jgi:hypothetical protein